MQMTKGLMQNGSRPETPKGQKTAKEPSPIDVLTAIMVALCLYMPDQIAIVAFGQLMVSLKVPAHNAEAYMAKLLGTKALANFLAAPIMIMVNIAFPGNRWISSLCLCALLLTRALLLVVFILPHAAVSFYIILIVQSFVRGLFENQLYPLAADHFTWISISYKASKAIVLVFQALLEIVMTQGPMSVVTSHMLIMFLFTSIATIVWFKQFILADGVDVEPIGKIVGPMCAFGKSVSLESGSGTPCTLLRRRLSSTNSMELQKLQSADLTADSGTGSSPANPEPTFFNVLSMSFSPMMMCLFGWPQKKLYTPWILPYAFVDRNKSAKLNIVLLSIAISIPTVIYFIIQFSPKLKERWTSCPFQAHLAWLFLIPGLCCMPLVFTALHYPGGKLYKLFHNNQGNVAMLYLVLIGSATVLDNMGFIGVAACSKINGKHNENAKRVIAITTFLTHLLTSFTYRISTGYMLVWRKYVNGHVNNAPTSDLTPLERLAFWGSMSMKYAADDLAGEVGGNIHDVVYDKPAMASTPLNK
ncbi:myosin light chain kinase domain containing protein protein, putative [Babesia ovis]|uniref:Myosin light chain kinase domain containing protein protein, putative n=1 Tax=Babesia ovis TaxID=5869 RepID=A0A9W5T8W0_BABOV|nr:myosin light chain kinase domain containing protein protein, putative [Babesia ovis]